MNLFKVIKNEPLSYSCFNPRRDKVAFVIQANGETVLKPSTRSVDDVFGRLHQKNGAVCSVKQMNEAVATRVRNKRS